MFLFKLYPPPIIFHIGLIKFCICNTLLSSALPRSQKSSFPLCIKTLLINSIADLILEIIHNVYVNTTVSNVLFSNGRSSAEATIN